MRSLDAPAPQRESLVDCLTIQPLHLLPQEGSHETEHPGVLCVNLCHRCRL